MHGFLVRRLARRLALIVVVLLLPGAAFADRTVDGVPIPDDVGIAADTAATSDSGRSFLGAWIGRWGGTLKHILIVESLQPDGTARVVYAVGDNPDANITRTWLRLPAILRDDTLTITRPFTATYRLTSATTATASFQSARGRSQADMAKLDVAALTATGRKVFVGDPESIMLATRLRENGQPIRLEVAIAKPEGNGPFPLVVINHGSTGRGDHPALFRATFAHPGTAEYFVRKGFMVAFPQRRGRGRSEGLYDEGFELDRSLGYACDPKLSLPGADRALADIDAAVEALRQRPDVAPQPIVMAGVSRGGILSVAYAGMHPREVAGAINFVGGWAGESCAFAGEINGTLFRRGAGSPHPTLWLYGDHDPFYSLDHSRANFAAFQAAGGSGQFFDVEVPGGNGHFVMLFPQLWRGYVDRYLETIGAPSQH
jgi:dienelactone hydrolase